jgi:CDP-glucose 4,6-dehydratase
MSSNRDLCRPFNFGPEKDEILEVGELLNLATDSYPEIKLKYSGEEGPHEAKLLMLDANAAKSILGWEPTWPAREAVLRTFAWYSAWREGSDMMTFTSAQIDDFCQA